jgi:hypothetical protein
MSPSGRVAHRVDDPARHESRFSEARNTGMLAMSLGASILPRGMRRRCSAAWKRTWNCVPAGCSAGLRGQALQTADAERRGRCEPTRRIGQFVSFSASRNSSNPSGARLSPGRVIHSVSRRHPTGRWYLLVAFGCAPLHIVTRRKKAASPGGSRSFVRSLGENERERAPDRSLTNGDAGGDDADAGGRSSDRRPGHSRTSDSGDANTPRSGSGRDDASSAGGPVAQSSRTSHPRRSRQQQAPPVRAPQKVRARVLHPRKR